MRAATLSLERWGSPLGILCLQEGVRGGSEIRFTDDASAFRSALQNLLICLRYPFAVPRQIIDKLMRATAHFPYIRYKR